MRLNHGGLSHTVNSPGTKRLPTASAGSGHECCRNPIEPVRLFGSSTVAMHISEAARLPASRTDIKRRRAKLSP